MITPMVKYTFLLLKSEQETFLTKLGELGVVDVTTSMWQPNEQQQRMLSTMSEYDSTLLKLKNIKIVNKNDDIFNDAAEPYDTAEKAVQACSELSALCDKLQGEINKEEREREELEVWGDFDATLIEKLKEEGVDVRFFCVPNKMFDSEWEKNLPLVKVAQKEDKTYFVTVGCNVDCEEAVQLKMPEGSAADKERLIAELKSRLTESKKGLARAVASSALIEEARKELKMELSHSKVVSTAGSVVDGAVTMIEGWVPKPRRASVDEAFESSDVIVFSAEPTLEDNPPILLKNNKFARLCEMISALYSMPGYRELDLTPFFAPFFVLFVGVCFGDLGYAIVTFIGALVAYFVMRKNDFARQVGALVMWCSFAAMIMGFLTGTFFGLDLRTFKIFDGFPFLGQMDMFTFALAVGIIQIVYAMFVNVYARIKYMGFKYAVSPLGWALAIVASVAAYLLPDLGVPFGFDSPVYMALMALFVVMNIFFSSPGKNIFVNFGSGLWGLYNNVTGLLGDVLSYIRLFALGLSSGIIAGVFNDLAVSMSGDVPVLKYVIMLIILLIGHGINLFMSAISSFVHPLRLTFVEFYKNAGFEGGGRPYEPYDVKKK